MHERFNLGDENNIKISITNQYRFQTEVQLIEELPTIFQVRDFNIKKTIQSGQQADINYQVRPFKRGILSFGRSLLFAKSSLGLIIRKYTFDTTQDIAVYPSIIALKHWQIIASSNALNLQGNKKQKTLGQSLEFDQIRDYTLGDDIRSINWKASARSPHIKANN